MGTYQKYRGNPENKLFYLVDQLIGGINTDFSDDTSPDNEFESIINFNMDKRGSLFKRKGFGKLTAVSEIFNMFDSIPTIKQATPEDPDVETLNDNVVYMKMLINDNNVFRNLSAFSGEKAYRQYQKVYGAQNNTWKLLMITTNSYSNTSTAWIFECTLPSLKYDSEGNILDEDTIIVSSRIIDLPVLFAWNRNLCNFDTVEFFDKIYFTYNDKCLMCFDRTKDEFTYSGSGVEGKINDAYKPSPMDIRKVGFNVLGDNPMYWIDYQGISTHSIQGVYLTLGSDIPLNSIPSGMKFNINIMYTGEASSFKISFKEGENAVDATVSELTTLNKTGLKVYEVAFKSNPTSEVEIKIEKDGASISPYYDYYTVSIFDPETKPVKPLNIGEYGVCEMYNRAVYYKDDTIWFSEINNFNYVPNYNYVSLPIEPTDKITKIIFFKNVYIIFTRHRIYKMLNAFGNADFQVMPVNLSIGCHAPNTVVPIENELYFASYRGLYSLKSSDYRDGIENLRELDTKVKSLTSDMTMYLNELSDPAVRYNGIPEWAYAVRYKDKYMLFFNNAYGDESKGVRDIDALVYQYELKAFSEIRFPIKPTFLFMVDNAIETFCTVKEKEEYTVEETLMEFDFETDTGDNKKVKDLSGNGFNADMIGGVRLAPGTGIKLNGSSYIKTGVINENQNILNGFTVVAKVDVDELNNAAIYSLKQNSSTGYAESETFSVWTNWANGYRGELICKTNPNYNTLEDRIDWTFRFHRDGTGRNGKRDDGNLFYLVDNTTGNRIIPATNFAFNMGGTYQDVKTGSFTITHNSSGNYSLNWKLVFDSYYPENYDYYTNSGNIGDSYTDEQYESWSKYWWSLRMKYNASVSGNKVTLNFQPEFVTKNAGAIYNRSQNCYVSVDGSSDNAYVFAMPAMSTNGNSQVVYTPEGGMKSVTFTYTGSKKVFIKPRFNIKITRSKTGIYYENFNVEGWYINLPTISRNTGTNWKWYSTSGDLSMSLKRIYKPSYREIGMYLVGNNEHQVRLVCTSEYDSKSVTLTNSNYSTLGEHNWRVVYMDYNAEVYIDGNRFGMAKFDSRTFRNATRDNSHIFDGLIGTGLSFDISTNKKIISYKFNEGSGTSIIDNSGNKLNGAIYGNYTWMTEKGLEFDGSTGYLQLPMLQDDVRFSNGFTVEFEARVNKVNKNNKVFDFATSYDTRSSKKCSISSSMVYPGNTVDMSTTSISNKTYKPTKDNADVTGRHKWKFTVQDTGKNYFVSIYKDGELQATDYYNYGGISNVNRKSNFIGRSNNPNEGTFSGMIYNFKITINASANPVPVYIGAMYEYETTYDDFGRPMEVLLETKGINLQYPVHSKKLKNVFVKGLGGYNYNEFFFEVYSDGHLINSPRVYNCYIDEVTDQVVYDYTDVKELSFDEMISLLGNIRLGYTKFGESTYETKKMIIPCTGKNFTIKIYGESSDHLAIESLGFTFKLGKVREE